MILRLASHLQLALLIFLAMPINNSYALFTDNHKNIIFMAEKVSFDNKARQGHYAGQVKIIQGHNALYADTAKTKSNKKNELIEANAYGNAKQQAKFETYLESNNKKLIALADSITYYPQKHIIKLLGKASLNQTGNTYKAPIIVYDIAKEKIISKQTSHQRVTITFKDNHHS